MSIHRLSIAILLALPNTASAAPPTWPRAQPVWEEGFDSASLPEGWEDQGSGRITLSAGASLPPTARGLAVNVQGEGQAYLQLYNLTPWPHREFPRDTYFSLWLHPNNVQIPPGQAISLVRMRDADWNVMAGVRLRQSSASYELLLELPDGSLDQAAIPIDGDWHEVMLGCRPGDWIGLWVDGAAGPLVSDVSHEADHVRVLLIGKADGHWSGETPSGTLYLD
ncbi:MAG: hypothetical protein RBU30_26065, partial [Polyangia bacterium]|nr:hypothetical protein [Polyangia bacterium]